MTCRIGFILLCLSPFLSYSQESSTGQNDSTTWNLSLDELVVTAQHEPTHYTNAMHKVRIIEGKNIEKSGMTNLAEVLSTRLNMDVTTDLSLGSSLTIRGISGENVQIMIDGVPVIGRLNGNIDLSQISVRDLQRIEIIEGAVSAQFGSNASGGVINLISRSGQVPKFEIGVKNQIESVGNSDHSVFGGWRIGKFNFRGNVRRYSSQLEPEDSLRLVENIEQEDGLFLKQKRYPWNPKLQWSAEGAGRYQWNDSLDIQYSIRYFDESLSDFGEVRRPAFKPYAIDGQYLTRRIDHALRAGGYIGDRIHFTSTQAVNVYDRIKTVSRKDFDEQVITEMSDEGDSTQFVHFLSRNMLSYVTPFYLDIQAGVEWQLEKASGERFGRAEEESSAIQSNTAGWLSLKYPLINSMDVLGSIRIGKNSRFDHPILPALQFLWKIDHRWSLRGGYARGFRAPSLKEMTYEFIDVNHFVIGNEKLEAETSSNFSIDLSTTLSIAEKGLNAEVGLYSNQIQNRIILAEYEPSRYTYANVDEYRTHGGQVGLEYPLTRFIRWKTSGGLLFLSNLYFEEDQSHKYSHVFEWQNNIEFHWPFIKTDFLISQKLTGRQQQFYVGDQGEIEEGFIGGMNMMHLSARRSFFKEHLALCLGVKNMMDVKSVPIRGSGNTTADAHSSSSDNRIVNWGRSFFIGLNYSFSRK